MKLGCACGVLIGALLLAAAPAVAQLDESEEEAIYSRYHKAMEVAKQCRNLTYDEQDHANMADVINEKINNAIGAKRLRLLTAAQREGRALVEDEGCDSPEAQDLLALFDRDLDPVLAN
ncbi:MAG: hypothetical protein AAF495_27915 [Pseudomonadota bacterium]